MSCLFELSMGNVFKITSEPALAPFHMRCFKVFIVEVKLYNNRSTNDFSVLSIIQFVLSPSNQP